MKTAWKWIIGVLATLLVLLLIAEAGIRTFLAHQITSGFEQQPGAAAAADPKVSFGSSPVTLGLIGGSLPHMTVETPSTLSVNGDEFSGTPAATIRLDKVRITGGEPVARDFQLNTELPNEFIRAILNQGIREELGDNRFLNSVITVSDVTSNPESGTFALTFTSGVAGIELRPAPADGQLGFEATNTKLFGFDLPSDVSASLSDAMAEGLRQEVTGGLKVQDMTVVPGGLHLEMTGHDVNLQNLQAETQPGTRQPAPNNSQFSSVPQPQPAGERS